MNNEQVINCSSESQNGMILEHLNKGKTITQGDAASMFGCWRLAARVSDLRGYGFPVEKIMEQKNGKRYARYFMNKGGNS